MSTLVDAVESLYRSVVSEPSRWSEQSFIDWAESVASNRSLDREEAKAVRRTMRLAQKLQEFWLASDDRADLGWASKVDMALGPKAWRPVLDLATTQLRSESSEKAFDDVARLFRLVTNQAFLDGMDYEDWRQQQKLP